MFKTENKGYKELEYNDSNLWVILIRTVKSYNRRELLYECCIVGLLTHANNGIFFAHNRKLG